MDAKKLLVKAIQLDGSQAVYYFSLASCMQIEEVIKIGNDDMNVKTLLAKAIELDPSDADFYYSLAVHLKADNYITISARDWYPKDLLTEAIKLNHAMCRFSERKTPPLVSRIFKMFFKRFTTTKNTKITEKNYNFIRVCHL